MSRIYMSSPDVGELEEQSVLGALRSGWIAPLGPDVDAFERELADRVGVPYAVALSSGTAALHLALLGVGAGPGSVVITSTMTFAATANAIVYTGAEPFFVDCDPVTGNLSPELLERALQDAAVEGLRVAAVLPVDLLGRVADYERIQPLAERYGVPVVSDAAESLGASRHGRSAASFGVAAALSFNGNKIMTTSGGGMLLTADEALAQRARYLATQARQPVAHYEHVDIGYNYRMSNLLAALGRAQLSRLDGMIARRRAIRERYRDLFACVSGVTIFQGADDAEDNCWLTSILVDPEVAGWRAAELSAWLAEDDIESRPLWKPMHLQPVFADARRLVDGSAERLFETGVTLPSGSVLTEEQLERVTGRIHSFIGSRTGLPV
ncbi:aminotransferase class I/II-fold pyridoxal phosphate-dependent enzyme [Leifsonia sp. fls2-241-R2A-40a]|uniref:DegT/DnrJ/EryC1/StrS family aminotransferase n=1 Tax=Leifsonia sp. fls2-241-R2A-40a TaxID=3040290 RepID=UPI00254B7D21|nr:aminotransferase class I/II-fold pyridoxal phosphate-dependent enzyme [Leifsonia sp. fls2-241-R2A-40a]